MTPIRQIHNNLLFYLFYALPCEYLLHLFILAGGMMQIVQEFEGQKVQQSLSSHLTDTSSLDGQGWNS